MVGEQHAASERVRKHVLEIPEEVRPQPYGVSGYNKGAG